MMDDLILTVNPGTTTTRCAIFRMIGEGVELTAENNIDHDEKIMSGFVETSDQLAYRGDMVSQFTLEHIHNGHIVACAGRGGMLTPVPAGVIAVNEELVDFALHRPVYKHASNLGAPLAYRMAKEYGVSAFVADPVSVDELPPVARISGCEDFPRFSFVHALNIRAVTRKYAQILGKPFDQTKAVVAHLGAGFSIASMINGRIMDNTNRMESSPFTPERCGGLPPLPLIEACYSGAYSKDELLKKLYGHGGVFGYLGTKDMRKVEAMVVHGNEKAALVLDAMLYQIGKAVGAMAAVSDFDLDGIILTGGLANSPTLVKRLRDRVQRLAPVHVFPGSFENEALAESAARVLTGHEKAMTWPIVMKCAEA